MIRSFLNIFLPEDEYKRMQVLVFMAESAVLTIFVLFILGTIAYFFNAFSTDTQVLLFLSPFLIGMYIFFRYILSGMEHTELFREKDYKKERRRAFSRSLMVSVVFAIAMLIVKGIPSNMSETYDIIFTTILFIIFYFIIEIISLKRSMKKNTDLDE